MLLKSDKVCVSGKYKLEVIELFGDVDLGMRSGRDINRILLQAPKILRNFYRNARAGNEPVEKNPIFILVPHLPLDYVHPDKSCEDVRFGTAECYNGHVKIVQAIGLFKGNAMLYICLDPLDDEDVQALEVASLGM